MVCNRSAADIHWDDLHKLLPGSEEYLHKEVVDGVVPEEERHLKINKAEDHVKRMHALQRNQDIVDRFTTVKPKPVFEQKVLL